MEALTVQGFIMKFVRLDLFRYRFTIQFGSLKQIGRYKF